jgi:hypothetical protein
MAASSAPPLSPPPFLTHSSLAQDRHAASDWADLDADDRAANELAGRTGNGRLLSIYDTAEHGFVASPCRYNEAHGPPFIPWFLL